MNTLLAPQRPSAEAEPLRLLQPRPRSTLLDRVAMRIGVWLLIWSTRPLPDSELERLSNQCDLDRERRELRHARYESLLVRF